MKIVSFVIPLYNTEKYIVDCIDSILEQKAIDLTFIEIIVVDDGSTDNSLSVLEKYNENESITIIKKSNSGISLTRNLGVERAKGDYIFFLDSDDKIAPGSLAKIFNILNNGNIDILFLLAQCFMILIQLTLLCRYMKERDKHVILSCQAVTFSLNQ